MEQSEWLVLKFNVPLLMLGTSGLDDGFRDSVYLTVCSSQCVPHSVYLSV